MSEIVYHYICIILDNLLTECDDIAIVGAGVGGTYAAWKLRSTQQVVTVYEYSDRVGGRLRTTQIKGVPDINVELGAMRFVPSCKHIENSLWVLSFIYSA